MDLFSGKEVAPCISQLFDIFSEALDGQTMLIMVQGEKVVLELGAQGSLPRLYQLIELARHAPPHLNKRWSFTAGLSRHKSAHIVNSMGKGSVLSINPEAVMVRAAPDAGNIFRLMAYVHDNQSTGISHNKASGHKAAGLHSAQRSASIIKELSLICSLLLGDAAMLRWISSIKFLKPPISEDGFMLGDLPEELKKRGTRLIIRNKDVSRIFSMKYPPQIPQLKDASHRPNLISGTTSCLPLVNEYMAGRTELAEQLHDDGACAVFIFWPSRATASPSDNAVSADDKSSRDAGHNGTDVSFNLDLARRLGQYVAADSGGPCAAITAAVCGEQFSWIDLLAWDIKKVTNRAREYFEKTAVPMSWIHSFCPGPNSLLLHIRPEFESIKDEVSGRNGDLALIMSTAQAQGAADYVPAAPAKQDERTAAAMKSSLSTAVMTAKCSH